MSAGEPKTPPTVGPQCGTHAGYRQHFRRNEFPCAWCRAGSARYTAVRRRAQRRLAWEFPDRFAELLAQEEAKAAGDG